MLFMSAAYIKTTFDHRIKLINTDQTAPKLGAYCLQYMLSVKQNNTIFLLFRSQSHHIDFLVF